LGKPLKDPGTIVRQDSPDDAEFRSPGKKGPRETLVKTDSPDDPPKDSKVAPGKPV